MDGQTQGGAQQIGGQGQPPINISITEDMKAGVYANAASASVTANELILDLGYIVPNEKPMTVKVVSRANMSIRTAESLVQLLQGSIGDYYSKVAKMPQGGQAQGQQGAQTGAAPMPSAAGSPIPSEGPTS